MPVKAVRHPRHRSRPSSGTILGQVQPDEGQLAYLKQSQACFVLGTNIDASQLSDLEVMQAYKSQAQAEGGFRFLKDPLFFVSSLFVKKPSRIQGLLTVMTFAFLVYSVTQRRLRQHLVRHNETVLNHITNRPSGRPCAGSSNFSKGFTASV